MQTVITTAIKWSYAIQFAKSISQVLLNIVLMRLIAPEVFGQVAMIAIAVAFLELFKSFGTEISIIHKSGLSEKEQASLYWFNGGLGILIGVLLFAGSPLISKFYHESSLVIIAGWFSVGLAINGFNTVPNALFQKSLDFRKLFVLEITSILLTTAVSIGLAILGFELESLLIRTVLAILIPMIYFSYFFNRRFGFRLKMYEIRSHLKFGLPIFGDNLLNFGVRNLDNLLIGKYLGTLALGFYSRSYSLLLLPLSTFSTALAKVMLPVFSVQQHDLVYIRKTYFKITRVIALVTFPCMLMFYFSSYHFILLFLGKQWLDLEPLIKIFSVLGAVQAIGTLDGYVFQALGKTQLQFKTGIVIKFFIIAMMITGFLVYKSVLAVAFFYAVASILAAFFGWYYLGTLFNSRLKEILMNLFPAFSLTLLAGLAVKFISVQINLRGINYLFFIFAAVTTIFTLTCRLFFPSTFREMVVVIKLLVCRK